MQFKPFEEGLEVNGQTVWSIVDGFSVKSIPSRILASEGIGTLDDAGILEIDPEGWYSQAAWLRAFRHIAEEVGTATLERIGKKIPENAIFPPWVVDIHTALKAIDIAYHLNHRKAGAVMFNMDNGEMTEGIGHYGYEPEEGKNRILCKCENPYPCTFDYGIVHTMARKFEAAARVRHLDKEPCRAKGANSCTYEVLW